MGGRGVANILLTAVGLISWDVDGFCPPPTQFKGRFAKPCVGNTEVLDNGSRSRRFMAKDEKLPDVIPGGTGDEKSLNRFMPASFSWDGVAKDEEIKTQEVEAGAGEETTGERLSAAVAAGAVKSVSSVESSDVSVAGADMTQEVNEVKTMQPEDVPTSFVPHEEMLMPNGGTTPCVIKVVGVGGGGGNAVNRMVQSGIEGVEFWSVNTDAQALSRNLAPGKLVIGRAVTQGLGAGGVPMVGRQAAEESKTDLGMLVENADMVFVTAGMGGGTGSGAAPLVAECALEQGSLTVGVVTKPFAFEGRNRMRQANEAIEALKQRVDTLIVVSNDKLLQIVPSNTPLQEAFLVADDILRQGVIGISEIIIKPGLVNVDFADVRSVMRGAGTALMGIGKARGKGRAAEAARAAIESPLLDFPVTDAKGIVFNIVGDKDLTLQEISEAANVVYTNVDPGANIIFGALVDPELEDGDMHITVLATGFGEGGGLGRQVRTETGASISSPGEAGPIRTQIPPPMDRPAASLVKDQLVYDTYGAPPPGLARDPSQQPQSGVSTSPPKKRGIFGFLKRVLLGR